MVPPRSADQGGDKGTEQGELTAVWVPDEAHEAMRDLVRAREAAVEAWPNLRAHCRTVSWLTMMPRAASISSTMRRLREKQK